MQGKPKKFVSTSQCYGLPPTFRCRLLWAIKPKMERDTGKCYGFSATFSSASHSRFSIGWCSKKQEIWRKTENGSKATSGHGSLPNESSEEEDEQNDEDSFLDEEMESLSGDEKSTVEENESFVEEDEILVEEEESSAEEENDDVFAEVDDNIENSAAEMSDDFENVISGKWILADFPVGRYRKPYVAKVIRHRTSNSIEAGNKLALLLRRFPHLKTMCTFGQLQTNRTNSMP